jgi:ketosteroid isomerase-like protein
MTVSPNVELVRSICADWERGNFSRSDWAHPGIEYAIVGGPMPGSWSGLLGMAEGLRQYLDAWDDFRITSDEYRELDAERVLVLFRGFGRGKASGLEMGQIQPRGANLFHVREGKVAMLVSYTDCDHAFADLGLAPYGKAP